MQYVQTSVKIQCIDKPNKCPKWKKACNICKSFPKNQQYPFIV